MINLASVSFIQALLQAAVSKMASLDHFGTRQGQTDRRRRRPGRASLWKLQTLSVIVKESDRFYRASFGHVVAQPNEVLGSGSAHANEAFLPLAAGELIPDLSEWVKALAGPLAGYQKLLYRSNRYSYCLRYVPQKQKDWQIPNEVDLSFHGD